MLLPDIRFRKREAKASLFFLHSVWTQVIESIVKLAGSYQEKERHIGRS